MPDCGGQALFLFMAMKFVTISKLSRRDKHATVILFVKHILKGFAMTNRRFVSFTLAFAFFVLSFQNLQAGEDKWTQFSDNLVVALKSENPGLQQSAMQMVIRYEGRLDVKEAVFDVMRVFRNQDETCVRRLALVALVNMNSDWALGFLERQPRFESNDTIRKHLESINFSELRNRDQVSDVAVELDEKDFDTLNEQLLALEN